MSKPLKGRIAANPAGTFTASLPIRKGAEQRRTATFDTKAGAERWLRDAIRDVEAGKDAPVGPSRRPAGAGCPGTSFLQVGADWADELYAEDEIADIGRERQVRTYIDAIDSYFRAHDLSVETIGRRQVKTMFRDMLKAGGGASADAGLPPGLDPDHLVTQKEALAVLESFGGRSSASSFKRARREGTLVPACTQGRAHLFRLGDIFTRASGLAPDAAPAATSSWKQRYAHTTLKDVRQVFNRVMEHALEQGTPIQPNVTKAKLPKNRTKGVKERPLRLDECARIARRLHVVHQLVLWLLRILGLRISEAYGILVDDVIDRGPGRPGVLKVLSQGGKPFHRRQHGDIVVSGSVNELKADSRRVLVVPAPLMDLIRVIIEVFHTHDDGTVQKEARLIPGLAKGGSGGQGAFRAALQKAAAAEGIDIREELNRITEDDDPTDPRPHLLRKSMSTELEVRGAKTEHIERFLGHKLGERVIHQSYSLEDPELRSQRKIAKRLTKMIRAALDGVLMVPTTVSCATGKQPALAPRAAHIEAALEEVGWLAPDPVRDGDRLTVGDVAALWDVEETVVRADIRVGLLAAQSVDRTDQGGTRYLIAVDDAYDGLERRAAAPKGARSGLQLLADELGENYDKVRQYIQRNPDLRAERKNGRRELELSSEAAAQVRAYFLEQQDLALRAVRLPEVATESGMSVAALDVLIKRGKLDEDVRFHGGIRSVTKASYENFRQRASKCPQR